MIQANSNAPVYTQQETTIAAPAATVWHLLASATQWETWNPTVQKVQATLPLAAGISFSWQSQGVTIQATVAEAAAPARLAWKGTAMGVTALHEWDIYEEAGTVRVRTAQSFEGPAALLMRATLQTTLENALGQWLRALKDQAEKIR